MKNVQPKSRQQNFGVVRNRGVWIRNVKGEFEGNFYLPIKQNYIVWIRNEIVNIINFIVFLNLIF